MRQRSKIAVIILSTLVLLPHAWFIFLTGAPFYYERYYPPCELCGMHQGGSIDTGWDYDAFKRSTLTHFTLIVFGIPLATILILGNRQKIFGK